MKINYTCAKGLSVQHIAFESAAHLHHKEAEGRNSVLMVEKH